LTAVFLDSSCVVALALGEKSSITVSDALVGVREVFAANLLEAEVYAALQRERVPIDDEIFWWVQWVLPDRGLGPEIVRVLAAGSLRGPDCWHLAVALSISPDPSELIFLSLDQQQRAVAERLGFQVQPA